MSLIIQFIIAWLLPLYFGSYFYMDALLQQFVDLQDTVISDNICKVNNSNECLIEWRDDEDFLLYYSVYVRVRITNGECENVTDVFNNIVTFTTPWEIQQVSPTVYTCITHGGFNSVMRWSVMSNNGILGTVLVDVATCGATPAAFYDNITCQHSTSGLLVYIRINETCYSELIEYKIRCSNFFSIHEGSRFEKFVLTSGTNSTVTPDIITKDINRTTYCSGKFSNPNVIGHSFWREYKKYITSGIGSLLVIIVALFCRHKRYNRPENKVPIENDIVNNAIYATPFRTTRQRLRTENNEPSTPATTDCVRPCTLSKDVNEERPYSVTVLETDSPNEIVGVLSRENPYSLATSHNPVLLHQPQYGMNGILSKENVYYTAAFDDEYAHLMRDTGRGNSNAVLIQENPYSVAVLDTEV